MYFTESMSQTMSHPRTVRCLMINGNSSTEIEEDYGHARGTDRSKGLRLEVLLPRTRDKRKHRTSNVSPLVRRRVEDKNTCWNTILCRWGEQRYNRYSVLVGTQQRYLRHLESSEFISQRTVNVFFLLDCGLSTSIYEEGSWSSTYPRRVDTVPDTITQSS